MNKRPVLRRLLIACLVLAFLICIFYIGLLAYNNVSFASNATFAKRIDAAIELAENWIEGHRMDILERKNAALLAMLRECNKLKANPVLRGVVKSYLSQSSLYDRGACWIRLVDPNWPVNQQELNRMIGKEAIDYKWILYALAPDKAKVTPEELQLFDPERWQHRKLTHQLYALTLLRETRGADEELNKLIEHICERLTSELVFDVSVVDIYIQKVAFVLRAGLPQKIRRRWVERIIANQLPDGGWNDRWFCFTSRRKPKFGLSTPPSDQHATVQALTALYLARYRYPEHFGLKQDFAVSESTY